MKKKIFFFITTFLLLLANFNIAAATSATGFQPEIPDKLKK